MLASYSLKLAVYIIMTGKMIVSEDSTLTYENNDFFDNDGEELLLDTHHLLSQRILEGGIGVGLELAHPIRDCL